MLTEGAADVDIVAVLGGRSCTIQVKTRLIRPGKRAYVIDWNPERMSRPDFVVLVLAPEGETPTSYVLPPKVVKQVWEVAGYPHPTRCNVSLTRAKPILERYRERWDVVLSYLEE
jgi:hypothetical protein